MQTTFLRGHRGSVVALQRSWDGARMLSASEDGSARIWDGRTQRTVRCLCPGLGPVGGAAFCGADEQLVAVASADTLSVFDLRRDGVVLRTASAALKLDLGADEELNGVAVDSDGLALCCPADNGSVYRVAVGEATDGGVVLHQPDVYPLHGNVCACAKFRSASKSSEIISGGYDCWMFHIDAPTAAILNSLNASSSQKKKQVVNPPFVHTLDVTASGQHVALGLGSGLVQVCGLAEGELCLDFAAHRSAVNAVQWLRGEEVQLWTAGNDHLLALWDTAPWCSDEGGGADGFNDDDPTEGEPALLISVSHPNGVNAFLASAQDNALVLYVADESDHIARYALPQG
eukprot:EG_transcript_15492